MERTDLKILEKMVESKQPEMNVNDFFDPSLYPEKWQYKKEQFANDITSLQEMGHIVCDYDFIKGHTATVTKIGKWWYISERKKSIQ